MNPGVFSSTILSLADQRQHTLHEEPEQSDIEDMEGEGAGMRMVVFGTSEFVKNRYLGSRPEAHTLMINTANWLVEQEDLIAIQPRSPRGTPLSLTNAQRQLILIWLAFGMPALLIYGGVNYSRRVRSR